MFSLTHQILLFFFIINYVSSDLSEVINIINSKNNFTHVKNLLKLLENNRSDFRGISTTIQPYKKWQVGRVSSKQYEIVNMLYIKPKELKYTEATTTGYQNKLRTAETAAQANYEDPIEYTELTSQVPLTFLPRLARLTETPSSIEFYYLDDEANVRHKYSASDSSTISSVSKGNVRNLNDFRFILADSPTLRFRVPDQGYKMPIMPILPVFNIPFLDLAKDSILRKNKTNPENNYYFHSDFTVKDIIFSSEKNKEITKHVDPFSVQSITDFSLSDQKIDQKSGKLVTSWDFAIPNGLSTTTAKVSTQFTNEYKNEDQNESSYSKATTLYDKIRFFETYDKQTLQNYDDYNTQFPNFGNYDKIKPNEFNTTSNILVEHMDPTLNDQNTNVHKPRHFRKHITDNNKMYDQNITGGNIINLIAKAEPISLNATQNDNINRLPQPQESTKQQPQRSWKTNVTKWSDYPFIGVYVYEPSQVYCDAASISSHWLVTAAECLSNHVAQSESEGQSAFVSYCSNNWWNLDLVAYVKYIVQHPRYRSQDITRRHLYNIGLIEVVGSMSSACYGWSPISLRSHPFVTKEEGTIAQAVGWGVNRLGYRQISSELPKKPLTMYENLTYSNSCPGNVEYSMSKELKGGGGTANVVCLSLPPYVGEKKDPVHGGLLLFEGKLVALYLQEERRPWGDQSAQYTGTWRHVAWILDVAREPELEQIFDVV